MARKNQLVHVILPGDRERFQREFPERWTPEQILANLAAGKRVFGFNATVRKRDKTFGEDAPDAVAVTDHGDPASGFAYDHPDTVVAIGEDDGAGGFREVRRIKGPPAKSDTPQGGAESPDQRLTS